MPHRDPKERIRAMRRWRERQTPGYYAWLYARRKLRFENADLFREAIEMAVQDDDEEEARWILEKALVDADGREQKVGNRYDRVKDRPYYEEEERA